MDSGQLVSDEIVLGIIRERLRERDARAGFVLDGFPRNIAQAQALDQMLLGMGQPLDLALLIDVDFDILLQRMVGRRTCTNCGTLYNMFTSPPKMDGQCDKCGGRLHHRADDNEETISNRLRVYDTQTRPLIGYYDEQGKLQEVDGLGEVQTIFRRMVSVIEAVRKQKAKASSAVDAIQAVVAAAAKKAKPAAEAPKPKAATKKKAPAKKKPVAKKKKVAVKKKKKAPAKKKPVVKKKKVAAKKKKAPARKQPVAKKKKVTAKKMAPAKKKLAAKKKKKAPMKKKPVAKKNKAPAKKKPVAKKKKAPTKKKPAKRKARRR